MVYGLILFLNLSTIAIAQLPSISRVLLSEAYRQSQFPKPAQPSEPVLPDACGPGDWVQIVDLDMTDPDMKCPSTWQLITSPHRLCGTSVNDKFSSTSILPINITYSSVCGRVTGFVSDNGNTMAFGSRVGFDGVNILSLGTSPIWYFVAGSRSNSQDDISRCPCDNNDTAEARLSLVGDQYFCDEPVNGFLWDGRDCMTDCCTFNSPPVFTTHLDSTTDTDIVVEIRNDNPRGANVFIQKINIFVD